VKLGANQIQLDQYGLCEYWVILCFIGNTNELMKPLIQMIQEHAPGPLEKCPRYKFATGPLKM
jgi:hypothetical protein